MVVAHSLEPINKEIPRPVQILAKHLARGKTTREIADELAGPDRAKAQRLTAKFRRMVATSDVLQTIIYQQAQGALIEGVEKSAEALARRGGKGNVPAAKLLFEASGFHNPKIQHEHSGDIKITLSVPRPPAIDNETGEPVEEAEVVE